MSEGQKSYGKAVFGLLFFTIIYFGTYDGFHQHLFPLLDILIGTDFEWFISFFLFIWDLMALVFIVATVLGMILAYQKKEPRSDIEYVQY